MEARRGAGELSVSRRRLPALLRGQRARRAPLPTDADGVVDDAWRLHAAVVDWTGKVDVKANFTLALESAVLGVIVTLTGRGGRLSRLTTARELILFWSGMTLLVLALLTAVWVVAPRLRAQQAAQEHSTEFVYFGHLRHWRPRDLEAALRRRDLLPVLSRNVVAMSRIAWRKHRCVQVSLWLAVCGTALVASSAGIEAALARL